MHLSGSKIDTLLCDSGETVGHLFRAPYKWHKNQVSKIKCFSNSVQYVSARTFGCVYSSSKALNPEDCYQISTRVPGSLRTYQMEHNRF